MKLHKILLALGLSVMSTAAMAQYEGTEWYDRIGTGEDSLKTRQNLSMFNIAIDQSNYAEAYDLWKPIMEKAPFANLRIYTDGAFMLENLLFKETDAAKKKLYLDELLGVFDTRLKNLDGLNSFAKSDRLRATQGDVLYPKAYFYAVYGPKADPANYSHDKAYEMFTTANRILEEQGGREIRGYMLDAFFKLSFAKYQADNNGFREQFLQDYLDSKAVCEKMLQRAKEETDSVKAKKIVADYDKPLNNIEVLFAQSKAADRDQIIAIFTPKIEANKTNLDYLKSALTLMAANDCDDAPIYYKAAEYAYNIEPTYESAIGTAQKYYKEGKTAESVKYFNDAIDLCKSDTQKGNIARQVAIAMRKSGNLTGAAQYLDKAQQYNPDLEGKCWMERANIAIKANKLQDAIAACNRAKTVDITLSGQADRLRAELLNAQARHAEYEKQKAAYDQYQKEQKAEEDFWKAGTNK